MAKVNPPPLQIPKSVLTDKEMLGFFQELLTVIRQLWMRIGGGSDIINNVTNFTAQTNVGSGSFEPRADDIERRMAQLSAQLSVFQEGMGRMPIGQAVPQQESDALKLAVQKHG